MKRSKRKGFTITELVIVIAVIAILAAVLIPTFSTIIKKANDSSDLQTARNIMIEYVAQENADVDDEYYIQVNSKTYYKVANGQLKKEPVDVASLPATGTYIVKNGTGDTATIEVEDLPVQTPTESSTISGTE